MDLVYFEHPMFILFPTTLLAWQFFLYFLKKKTALSQIMEILLTGIGAVGHAVAITIILLFGGTLSDVLVLVLLSSVLSLLLSPSLKIKEEE